MLTENVNSNNFPSVLFSVIDGCLWEKLPDLFHDDAEYHRPGYSPLRGIAEISDFYKNIRIISAGRHKLDDVIASGSAISCHGVFTGKSKSGSDLYVEFSDYYKIRDNRIMLRKTFFYTPAI